MKKISISDHTFITGYRIQSIIRWTKDKWHLLVNENDNPHDIAVGLSIGIFGGMVPIIGLQTLLIILLLWISPRPNYAAAMYSSFVMNHFTIIPILYLDYRVGILFIRPMHPLDFMGIQELIANKDVMQLLYIGKEIYIPMLVGGVLCGIFFSLLTYGVSYYLVKLRRGRVSV